MLIALISVNQIHNNTCMLMYLNSHQQSRNQRFEARNRSSSRNWDEDDYHIEFRLIEIGLSHDRWANNRVCKEDIWEGVRLKRRRRFFLFFFFFCFLNWFLTKKTMLMDGDEELELNLELFIYSNGFWHVWGVVDYACERVFRLGRFRNHSYSMGRWHLWVK